MAYLMMWRLTYEDKKPKEMRRDHGVCDIPLLKSKSPSGLEIRYLWMK
jgi:hypothetical protein